MSGKDENLELDKGKDPRPENHGDDGRNEISIAPLLSDLVAFADELNTRNIRETEANQKFRESQLRWQKYYVVTTAVFAALTFIVIYAFYGVAIRLTKLTDSEVKIASAQLGMLDRERAIGEVTIATMKAQLSQQLAADRPVVTVSGVVPAKVGKSSQNWSELKSNGTPPRNVAVSWHNSGDSIATDFVETGQLIAVKSGDPPPVAPACNEDRPAQKEHNGTSLAPDNTIYSIWSAQPDFDPTSADNGQMIYAVGCAYYNGLGGGREFFSDVCLLWNPGQESEFKPCQDSNRNHVR